MVLTIFNHGRTGDSCLPLSAHQLIGKSNSKLHNYTVILPVFLMSNERE